MGDSSQLQKGINCTLIQRTLTVAEKDHCTAGLWFNKTGFDQK